MNINSTHTITADWEYDERRFENEANTSNPSSGTLFKLPSVSVDPGKLVKSGESLFADVGSAIGELFTDITGSKEESKTQIGGKTEIKFNQSAGGSKEKEEAKTNQKKAIRQKEIASEQAQVRSKEVLRKIRTQQAEAVNKKIGGISNISYEGTVNENGQIRVDVQTYLDQANSDLSEEQLKEKRQSQIAKVTGKSATGAMGENELLKGGENFGHFTKAVG